MNPDQTKLKFYFGVALVTPPPTVPDPAPTHGALRRVPTQSRSREKVDRALAAADALLLREGVGALSLSRVAQEAEVSVGALYQYLPDREAIVAALTAAYHTRHEALMDDLVAQLSNPSAADPVGAIVAAVARLYREEAGTRALRAGLQGVAHLDQTRDHKNRMVAKVQRLLVAHRLVGPDEPDLVARAVFFAADGVMHEVFAETEGGDALLLAELETLLRAYLHRAARTET